MNPDELIELQALMTDREAMKIANVMRDIQGFSPAYGEQEFFELSEKMRLLISSHGEDNNSATD